MTQLKVANSIMYPCSKYQLEHVSGFFCNLFQNSGLLIISLRLGHTHSSQFLVPIAKLYTGCDHHLSEFYKLFR